MRRGMRSRGRAILGDHNAISDITGFKYKASEMRKMDGVDKGLLVHSSEWNPEQPQLHLTVKSDDMSITNARPRQTDVFADNASGDYLLQNGDLFIFNSSISFEVSFN